MATAEDRERSGQPPLQAGGLHRPVREVPSATDPSEDSAAGCGFTLAHYASILERARSESYDFPLCRDHTRMRRRSDRTLLLRHDVDYSLEHALRLARAEHDRGVRSTYFVRVRSRFYDPTAGENPARLRWLIEHGFEVGLHYSRPEDDRQADELGAEIEEQKRLLEGALGTEVEGVAEHMPARRGRDFDGNDLVMDRIRATLNLRYDAYAPAMREGFTYISDSNRRWRHGCLHTMIGREDNLYVVVHPVWWFDDVPYERDHLIELLREGH